MAKRQFAEAGRPFRGPKRRKREPGRKLGAKQPVNVSVDAELLKVAKDMKINLSLALENALGKLTAEERARRFYEENKSFMDWHNVAAKRHGTSSEVYAREFGTDDRSS